MTSPRNLAASVRDRLTDRARRRGENAQRILVRYAIERLLYRLSQSAYADRFVLKGAMLFSVWTSEPFRSTGDLDMLAFASPRPEDMVAVFREICSIEVEPDGVEFVASSVRAYPVREEDEYQGLRLTLQARITSAELAIQVDIGFGDVVTPEAQQLEFPSLLGMPAPRLRAYPPETVVAEKYQAMVKLGMTNSRLKDFFDIWAIAETFETNGLTLARAIQATFERRSTGLSPDTPDALTPAFAEARQPIWAGFLRRTEIAIAPPTLPEVQTHIAKFVLPPTRAILDGMTFERVWRPGGPWG